MWCKVWLEVCTSHAAVWHGTRLCPSPMDRASVQNLGNPSHPQHCSRRQGDEPEKKFRENLHIWESSQGAEPSLRLAQPARTIRSPKCRWSGMKRTVFVSNAICQLSSKPQAVMDSVRKCSVFFAQAASLVCLQPYWSRQHTPIWTKVISSFHVSHCLATRTAATLKSQQLAADRPVASEQSVSYPITNPLSHPKLVWNAHGPACQSQARVGVGGRKLVSIPPRSTLVLRKGNALLKTPTMTWWSLSSRQLQALESSLVNKTAFCMQSISWNLWRRFWGIAQQGPDLVGPQP